MIFLLLLIISCVVLYFRASLLLWTGAMLVFLLLWSRWGETGSAGLIFFWTLYLVMAVMLNFRGLRRKLMTRHILPIYQSHSQQLSS